MKRLRTLILCVSVIVVAAPLALAQAPAIRIDSTGGVDPRVVVAVPDFAAAPGLESSAKVMAAIVAYDLDFFGVAKILPRSSYPQSFTAMTPDATQVDFAAWKTVRVEFVVHGYVSQQNGQIVAECRLLDVAAAMPLEGVRYTAPGQQARPERIVAHKFSDDAIKALTGIPGAASSEICYSGGSSGKKEIYIADYDGGYVSQVTKFGSISIKPKFSPNGQKIAFLSYKDRYPYLYIYDRRSGQTTPFSKRVGLNAAPAWSPDSSRLVYVLSKDANTEIYVKNADGSNEQRLTNNRSGDTSPAFSPDGRQIVFVSDRDGRPQIYVMNADGSNQHRVSRQGNNCVDPQWSPDGKYIAYVVETNGMQIYAMSPDGSNAIALTNGGNNESPAWSPDSRSIVFSTTRRGKSELFSVNLVKKGLGIDAQPMPYVNAVRCEGPSWGPRRTY